MKPDLLFRLPEILGQRATPTRPAIAGLIPVSEATWWEGVKSGRYPKPVRIGPRCVAWRVSDIARVIEEMNMLDGRAE